jgi:hypothetical protein
MSIITSRLRSRRAAAVALIGAASVAALGLGALSRGSAGAQAGEPEFTTDFSVEACDFKARGVNQYFDLTPGYHMVLEGEEDGEEVGLEVSVLHQRQVINLPGIGEVKTRVVHERHTVDGEVVELSWNYFAICRPTNDVFYFGEKVDIFNDDGTVTHEGEWLAGVDGNQPGIIMPGRYLLGARYYQEIAPGIALDRAKNIAMGLQVTVPAGTFDNCVQVVETTPLEPGAESLKTYCHGVGLVADGAVELIEAGFPEPSGLSGREGFLVPFP